MGKRKVVVLANVRLGIGEGVLVLALRVHSSGSHGVRSWLRLPGRPAIAVPLAFRHGFPDEEATPPAPGGANDAPGVST